MKIHLIAIGGSAMHNMALALHEKGFEITGSDDAIFNPSRKRLEQAGLFPEQLGWFPEKITKNIDAIINLKEAILVGVKLDKQILITKKEDPQIAAKITRSIKLFDNNLFNKN